VTDVLLDSAAALAAAAIAATGWRTAAERLTGLLLWLAAAGGVVMLAVDLALGVPSGWLWLSTPAAALALALRHRLG
jgi:hypothetical protein